MYELVDAVNQQFPLPNGAGHLLVLTKFAELVANPKNPVRRLGLERFVAMTRMNRKTVKRQLKWLHEQGFLVCLDADAGKKSGDRPKLYKLQLPEGYDPVVISRRRARYYGGKPFCPKFFEWNDGEALKKEMELDPVPTDILSGTEDKMSVRTDKMHPLNKRKNKNNNNENVVVGDSVRLVLKSAAKATGASMSSFDDLGISAENVAEAQEAIDLYRLTIERNPATVKTNPAGYLRSMIAAAIKGGGMKALVGEVAEPDPEPKASGADLKGLIRAGWAEFRDGIRLDKRLDEDMVAKLERDYALLIGSHQDRDIPVLIGIFKSDFDSCNPDSEDLSATALKKRLTDFMDMFSREH